MQRRAQTPAPGTRGTGPSGRGQRPAGKGFAEAFARQP